MKYSDSFDENVDLVGLGMANVAAGFSGTFVVNGSPTKTEMVDSAGGRTQIAQLTAAAIVVVVLLFLTGPLAYMPNAVLASVVFLIGLRLVDYKGMADIYRLRKGEFAVAAITAAVVVVVGVEQGIILAMALSIVEHIYHSYRPYDTLLRRDRATGAIETRAARRDAKQSAPGLAVYRFGASLYYANAPAASPRRSWTSSRAPTRRSAGSCSSGRPSATSTTRAPTRSARSRRSSTRKGVTLVHRRRQPERPSPSSTRTA